MIFSFKYSAGILMALMAIDMPTQSNALSMVECAEAYQIDGDDTMAEMQQKMMAFLFNPSNCPVFGPTSETPECCFITPPLTRITADEAFDAYQTQTIRGKNGVIMVDVRTPEELYWTGQPAQVNKITLKHGDEFTPTNYRSTLRTNGGGNSKLVSSDGITFKADQVESVDLSPIAFSIPVEYRNVTTDDKSLNNEFGANMLSLFSSFPGEAAIFFCRSGKRSSVGCYIHYCTELLQVAGSGMTFYEVDAVDEITGDEKSGNGGFEGSTYSNKYLGYRGFPGRLKVSPYSAVDFKDSGLPIIIGKTPQTLEAHNDMSPPYKCLEDDTYSICQSSMFS